MKILSVNIHSFGKLQNKSINFKDGANVLRYDNGYGKTTLATFVRAMLYGFKYSRAKRGNESVTDASVWMTWHSTEKIGGNMVVEHNGDTYKIQRFFGTTAKQETLSVTNVKTQKPLDVSGGVGEYFLGLTSESFDRSAYYPQESVEISSNENLNTRLAGLVQNAADDLNKVQDNLRKYKKSLRYERGNGGEIFRLEEEIFSLQRQIEERKRAQLRKSEMDARLKEIAAEQETIKKQTAEANANLASLQKKLAAASPTEAELATRNKVAQLQTKLQRMDEFEQDKKRCDDLAEQIAKTPDAAQVQRPVSKPMRLGGITLAVLGVILAIVGALGLALAFLGQALGVSLLIVGIVVLVIGGVLRALSVRVKPAIQTLQAGPKDQLITDYFTIAGKYVYCERMSYDEAQKALWEKYAEYMGDKRELTSLIKTLSPASHQQDALQDEIEKQQRNVEYLRERAISLSAEYGRMGEIRNNLETNFVELQEKLEETQEQLSNAKHRFDIASKVSDLLDRANENLATSYLPDLCTQTAQLLSAVTGETYQLEMDQNFAIKVVVNGASRHLDDFSRGIREITLLCFRLAISRLLFGGEIPFLIIDDAFVNFDEPNFLRATSLIKGLVGTQVIYFTCHNRLGNLK